MRKKIIIFILPLLLSGCMMITNNYTNYLEIINTVISSKSKLTNTQMIGYKLYLPNDVKHLKKDDYNEILLIKDRNAYLYVDLVSYYYKKTWKNQSILVQY